MNLYHDIKNIRFIGQNILMTIDGKEKKFKIKEISTNLWHASEKERNTYNISPSGYGIHWPLIDEDIAIDGLLGIAHTKKPKSKSA